MNSLRIRCAFWCHARAWLGGCCVAVSTPFAVAIDPPTELPPLLPVPGVVTPPCDPPRTLPTGPEVEYDRSLLYLHDRAPVSPPVHRTRAEERRQNRLERAANDDDATDRVAWLTPSILLGNSSDGPAPSGMAGDGPLTTPYRAGLILDAGKWFDEDRTWAMRAGMLYLGNGVNSRSGYGITGGPSTLAAAEWSSQYISADLAFRHRLTSPDDSVLQLAADLGYQFAYLGEDLSLSTLRTLTTAKTRNQFHGAELGLIGEWRSGLWSADIAGRIGLGVVIPDVSLSRGTATGTDPRFGVLPTVNATVGRQVTDASRAFVGYSFQYLTSAARPGAVLNGSTTSDYWVQGVNLGLRWEY